MTSVVTASSTDVALALHYGMESLHNATVFTDLQAGSMLAAAHVRAGYRALRGWFVLCTINKVQ
jgi:hypothetical protein